MRDAPPDDQRAERPADGTVERTAGTPTAVTRTTNTTDDDDAAPVARRWTAERLLTAAVVGMLLALVLIRLGTSLLGLQVFAGADLLSARAPWNDGGTVVKAVNPFVGDTIDSIAPAFIEAQKRFWDGDLPLWTNLAGPGAPLLASINRGLLNPISGWLLVLPTSWGLGFVKLLQILVAFGGMALWLRRLGVRWFAAAFGGLAYCGTGFFVGWSNWVMQTTAAALIPVLFWAAERFIQERRVTAALPIAAATAFLLLSGFPAAAGHALYAAAAYFLVRLFADRVGWLPGLRQVGLAAGAVVLGVLISAYQLLGLSGQLSETDLSYRGNQFFGELPLRSFLSGVLPRAFTPNAYPTSNPIESYAYLGAAVILLAVIGTLLSHFTAVRRGVVVFLVIGTLVAGAIAWFQGWWTAWLSGVPVLSGSAPGRLRDLTGVFVVALAAIGADVVLAGGLNRFTARHRTAVVMSLGLVGVLGMGGLYLHYRGETADVTDLRWDVVLGVVSMGLVVAAAVLWRRSLLAAAAMALAVAVVGTQIIVNSAFYWPTSDPEEFYPENGLITAAQASVVHDRAASIGAFLGSTAAPYGIRTVTGHSFTPEAWKDYLAAIEPEAFSGPGRTPTNPDLQLDLTGEKIRSPLLDRMGTRWVIAGPGKAIPGTLASPDGSPVVDGPAEGRMDLPTGATHSVPSTAGPIRAVQLQIAESSGSTVELAVSVRGADGTELARGDLASKGIGKGWVTVPLAGEALPAGAVTLEVENSGAPLVIGRQGALPRARVVTPIDDTLRLAYADSHGTLWERMSSLSRVRWASTSQVIADPAARLATLAAPGLPADTVVLDAGGPDAPGGPAQTEILDDSGDRLVVDVTAEGAGHLVVADPMTVNWEVRIDGTPADIVPADDALSAVAVPAGSHRVEFTYVGSRATLGLLASAAGLLIFIVVLVGGWWIRRRRAAPAAGDPAASERAADDTAADEGAPAADLAR